MLVQLGDQINPTLNQRVHALNAFLQMNPIAGEGFPDWAYNPDGTLMLRSQAGVVIESPKVVAENALKLIKDGILFGEKIVRVDTLCLHGDNPCAAENAKLLRGILTKSGIEVVGLK